MSKAMQDFIAILFIIFITAGIAYQIGYENGATAAQYVPTKAKIK